MYNNRQKELIRITKKLIHEETISPLGEEIKCKKFLLSEFKKIGLKTKIIFRSSKRPNIIGYFGESADNRLVVLCHIDVVQPGSGWKHNPFKAKVYKNKITGRGAIDDKGPLAVAMVAIKEFIKDKSNISGEICLVAVADEENDNEYGVKHLLSQGFTAKAALVPDGGYLNSIEIGEMGCIQMSILSKGKQEHSALSDTKNNAIHKLITFINKIEILNNLQGDSRFEKSQLNISKISGGNFANSTAKEATCQIDLRFPPPYKSKNIQSKIDKIAKELKINIKYTYTTEPHIVENEIWKKFVNAGKRIGMNISPITLKGNSVAKELNQAGIPSIVHYPASKVTAHEANEYILISEMDRTVDLYKQFFKEYFS